jgi:HK97 family phage prohead protease
MTNKTKTIDELRKGLPKRERRERGKVEIRAKGDGKTIEMFIPYKSESVDMGFREVIEPGAFSRSIRSGRMSERADIYALWSHDSSQPLARQANDTLDFEERDDGLVATAMLVPEIDYHQRALQAVQAGLVRGTSFGFETVRDEWTFDNEGNATRSLQEVKLFEVSPVVFPAYERSDIEARSAVAQLKAAGIDADELLTILREVKDGKAPAERRECLTAWVARLGDMVPPGPVNDDYWAKRIASRERLFGKVA